MCDARGQPSRTRHRRPPCAFSSGGGGGRLSGVSSASTPRPRHHEPLRRPPTRPIRPPARAAHTSGLDAWIRRAAQSGFAFHPSPSAPFFFSALAASDAAFGFADARGRPDGVVLAGTTDSAAVVEVDALPIDRSVASTCTLGGAAARGRLSTAALQGRAARGAAVFPAAHHSCDGEFGPPTRRSPNHLDLAVQEIVLAS